MSSTPSIRLDLSSRYLSHLAGTRHRLEGASPFFLSYLLLYFFVAFDACVFQMFRTARRWSLSLSLSFFSFCVFSPGIVIKRRPGSFFPFLLLAVFLGHLWLNLILQLSRSPFNLFPPPRSGHFFSLTSFPLKSASQAPLPRFPPPPYPVLAAPVPPQTVSFSLLAPNGLLGRGSPSPFSPPSG